MIGTARVYLDPSGGVRLYIPRDIVSELGWKNHNRLILKQHDGRLKIYLEKDYEPAEDNEHLQKQEVEA